MVGAVSFAALSLSLHRWFRSYGTSRGRGYSHAWKGDDRVSAEVGVEFTVSMYVRTANLKCNNYKFL